MFDFITFGIKDLIDIAAVVFLVYQLYRLIRGTVAVNIFIGVIALFILWKVVEAFQMTLLSGILGQFMSIGVIAIVILFQQEIRRFLILIGTNNFFVRHFFSKIKRKRNIPEKFEVKEIANACFEMARTRTGALIVFKKSMFDLKEATSGDVQNIVPTQTILESIFYKNSPLHDGAIVIENGRSWPPASSCPFRGTKTCRTNTARAIAPPWVSPKNPTRCPSSYRKNAER